MAPGVLCRSAQCQSRSGTLGWRRSHRTCPPSRSRTRTASGRGDSGRGRRRAALQRAANLCLATNKARRQTDRQRNARQMYVFRQTRGRYLVENKDAPLTYDVTAITSNFVPADVAVHCYTDLYNTQRKFADYETWSCPSKNTLSD